MHMGMTLCLAPQLVQTQTLSWEGDMASSLFPHTEKLLKETKYQRALKFIISKHRMEPYRDFIDCLFCELIPGFRMACFRYYNDEGPQLMYDRRATTARIAAWDQFLVTSLKTAVELMKRDEHPSWYRFREYTREAVRHGGN